MKASYFILLLLLSAVLFYSCTTNTDKTTLTDKKIDTISVTDTTKDKIHLQTLVKDFYKWWATKNSKNDFIPIEKDSLYVGLDLKAHAKRLEELKATNFFSEQFLDNYNNLGLTIDEKLKSGKLKWYIGDLPPFGNEADPWCNCQDTPSEKFWEDIKIIFLSLDTSNANLEWTWGKKSEEEDNFEYTIKAIKINGVWKIAYLQGFDAKVFLDVE